jgi:hypothetical protein
LVVQVCLRAHEALSKDIFIPSLPFSKEYTRTELAPPLVPPEKEVRQARTAPNT